MLSEADAGAELIAAGRRLYDRRVLASYEGNLSVLVEGGILTTPTGVHKGRLTTNDLVVTDRGGKPLGKGQPSSELKMHLAIYEERSDIGAIVHAHPPIATGYAVAGLPLPVAALAETVSLLGCVPMAPYGTPSTDELADSVRQPIRQFDVVLLANHGAVTIGADLREAEERMYQLEHFAHIALVSHQLGGPQSFSTSQVERLSQLRQDAGGEPIPPVCYPCAEESGTITLTSDELVELIADALRALR